MTGRQTVRDDEGNEYLLVKRSGEASLVRDPETGKRQHLPNDELVVVDGQPPLVTAATAVPDELVTLLTAVPDERALGLLVELDTAGPMAVRTLLAAYDLCESDLHGLLAELRAAGLVEERRVGGERGYGTTDDASDALDTLRGDPDD